MEWFLSDVWFTLLTQMATAAILGCFRGIVHQKKKNSVVFLNLYEFPSAVERKRILGTILVTKQLLHDFHSMKKKKRKKNTLLESMGTRNLLVWTFFKISSFMLRWTKKFIQVQNNSRLSKWWQYFHFWVNYPFKISSYNSRNSHSLLHFTCMLYL